MKQLISGDEAEVVQHQPTSPCSDCPFARVSLPGWLGTESADVWMQLAHGEGSADCHALRGPDDPWACAGLAIYRANICKLPHNRNAFKLPADRKLVFASRIEFLAHHKRK